MIRAGKCMHTHKQGYNLGCSRDTKVVFSLFESTKTGGEMYYII